MNDLMIYPCVTIFLILDHEGSGPLNTTLCFFQVQEVNERYYPALIENKIFLLYFIKSLNFTHYLI